MVLRMSATQHPCCQPIRISDAELRALRDAVYPAQCEKQIQDDSSWEQIKDTWRKDVEWLKAQVEKLRK